MMNVFVSRFFSCGVLVVGGHGGMWGDVMMEMAVVRLFFFWWYWYLNSDPHTY
jgi:hypothetical protein